MPNKTVEYTPQEAAALVDVPLPRIQNAITKNRLGRSFARKGKERRRRIDLPAVLTFALQQRLPKVRIPAKTLYVTFRQCKGIPHKPIVVDEAVTIDAPRLLAGVIENIERYDRVDEFIETNPRVMGGLPVIKGTRLPVRTIIARRKAGETVDDLIQDYPYLSVPMVAAAELYAKANPERGRPVHARG